jgi:thioredoxin 1
MTRSCGAGRQGFGITRGRSGIANETEARIMSNIIVLTEDNFESEISSGSIAIDFYADWCQPCKMMAPTFHEAADTYDGKIKFAKVDIEDQRKLALSNKVMSIPTLLFFKDGALIDRVTGVIDQATLARKLEAIV